MPVNMITALWQMAEKRKDYVVLSDMLKFDYLPEYCLKQARNIKDSAVRCAYLLRPETTNRKELLDLENRSSVFAAVAELGSTDTQVRDAILKRMREKPTKVLANGVLNSGLADTECIIEALRTLGACNDGLAGLRVSDLRGLKTALTSCAENFTNLVTCLVETRGTHMLSTFDVEDVSDAHIYLPGLVAWFSYETAECSKGTGIYTDDQRRWRWCSPLLDVVSTLHEIIALQESPDEDVLRDVRVILEKYWYTLATELALHSSLLKLAKSARYEPNYARVLKGVAKEAKSAKGARLETIIRDVTKNKVDVISARTMDIIVGILSNEDFYELNLSVVDSVLALTSPVMVNCAVAQSGSKKVLEKLWLYCDSREFHDSVWDILQLTESDKVSMLNALTDLSKDGWKEYAVKPFAPRGAIPRRAHSKLESLLSTNPSLEFYKQMPWETVCTLHILVRRYDGDSSETPHFAQIELLLNEHLADTLANWEAFADLSRDWTGLFGDLLQASTLL